MIEDARTAGLSELPSWMLTALEQHYRTKLFIHPMLKEDKDPGRPVAEVSVRFILDVERQSSYLGIRDSKIAAVSPPNPIAQMWAQPLPEDAPPRHVIISGDLTTGKTTACQKLVQQWLTKEIWPHVPLVLWLNASDINQISPTVSQVDIVARYCLGITTLSAEQRPILEKAISRQDIVWILDDGDKCLLPIRAILKSLHQAVITSHRESIAELTDVFSGAAVWYIAPLDDAEKIKYIQQFFAGSATAEADTQAVQTALTQQAVFRRILNLPVNLELVCRLQQHGLLAALPDNVRLYDLIKQCYEMLIKRAAAKGIIEPTRLHDQLDSFEFLGNRAAFLLMSRERPAGKLIPDNQFNVVRRKIPQGLQTYLLDIGVIQRKQYSPSTTGYYFLSDLFLEFFSAHCFASQLGTLEGLQAMNNFTELNQNNKSLQNMFALWVGIASNLEWRQNLLLKLLDLPSAQDILFGCLEELASLGLGSQVDILDRLFSNMTERTFDPPLDAYPRLTSNSTLQGMMLGFAGQPDKAIQAVEFFSQFPASALSPEYKEVLLRSLAKEQDKVVLDTAKQNYYFKISRTMLKIAELMPFPSIIAGSMMTSAVGRPIPFPFVALFALLSQEQRDDYAVRICKGGSRFYSRNLLQAIDQYCPGKIKKTFESVLAETKRSDQVVLNVLNLFFHCPELEKMVTDILLQVWEHHHSQFYPALCSALRTIRTENPSHFAKMAALLIRIIILEPSEQIRVSEGILRLFLSLQTKQPVLSPDEQQQMVGIVEEAINANQALIQHPLDELFKEIFTFLAKHINRLSPASQTKYLGLLADKFVSESIPYWEILLKQPRAAHAYHKKCIEHLVNNARRQQSIAVLQSSASMLTQSEKTIAALALKNIIVDISKEAKKLTDEQKNLAETAFAALEQICENWRPEKADQKEFLDFFKKKLEMPGHKFGDMRVNAAIILLILSKQLSAARKYIPKIFKKLEKSLFSQHISRLAEIFSAPELLQQSREFYQITIQPLLKRDDRSSSLNFKIVGVLETFLTASQFGSADYDLVIGDLFSLMGTYDYAHNAYVDGWVRESVKIFLAEADKFPDLWKRVSHNSNQLLFIILYGQKVPPNFARLFTTMNDVEKMRFIGAIASIPPTLAHPFVDESITRLHPALFQVLCQLIRQWLMTHSEQAIHQFAHMPVGSVSFPLDISCLANGLLCVSIPAFFAVYQKAFSSIVNQNHLWDVKGWAVYFRAWAAKQQIIVNMSDDKSCLYLIAEGVRQEIPLWRTFVPVMEESLSFRLPDDESNMFTQNPRLLSRFPSKICDIQAQQWLSTNLPLIAAGVAAPRKRVRDEKTEAAASGPGKSQQTGAGTPSSARLSENPQTLMPAPSNCVDRFLENKADKALDITMITSLTRLAGIRVQQETVYKEVNKDTVELRFALPTGQVETFSQYYDFVTKLQSTGATSAQPEIVIVAASFDINLFKTWERRSELEALCARTSPPAQQCPTL